MDEAGGVVHRHGQVWVESKEGVDDHQPTWLHPLDVVDPAYLTLGAPVSHAYHMDVLDTAYLTIRCAQILILS